MPSKARMLCVVTLLIVGGFLITSLLSFFVSRENSIEALAKSELPLTSDTIYSEVQRDLIGPQIVSSVMANDTFVRDWISGGEQDERKIAEYLTEIVEKYDAFTAFLVVDETANFYVPSGFVRKVSPEEPRDKWYYRTKQNTELIELNVDPSEVENEQLTIFFNVRMLDENDEFMAAIGLGLNRNLLNSKLENYRQKYGHRVHFLTPSGKMFLHEDASLEGKNVRSIEGLSDIADELLSRQSGVLRYEDNERKNIVHARYIQDIDLILLVEADIGLAVQSLYTALLWNLLLCLVITAVVLIVLLATLRKYQKRLESIASTDELTGLSNRQSFNNDLQLSVKSTSNRSNEPMATSLLLIDIDHFKRINDQSGHVVGDSVLKTFGRLLYEFSPKGAQAVRWGGEEFVMLVKNADLNAAHAIAEDFRITVETNETLKTLVGDYVTVSIGVVEYDVKTSFVENFQRADKLMYKAKAEGRNRVVS